MIRSQEREALVIVVDDRSDRLLHNPKPALMRRRSSSGDGAQRASLTASK